MGAGVVDRLINASFSSFRGRLTLAFVALFAITAVLTIIAQLYGIPPLYNGIREEVRRDTFRTLALSVELCRERLNWWLLERSSDIELLSSDNVLKENFLRLAGVVKPEDPPALIRARIESQKARQDIVDSLVMLQTAYRVYDSIEIADARSGVVIISTNPENIGAKRSEKDYFTNALLLNAFQGLEINTTGRNHFFVISRILPSPVDATPLGVIIMRVRSAHALEPARIIGPSIGKGGEIVMMDADADVLTTMSHRDGEYTPRDMFQRAALDTPGAIAAVRRVDGEMEAFDYRNEPVLAAFRYISLNRDYGFGLVVKMDMTAVKEEIRRRFIPQLMTNLVFFALLAVLIYVVSGKFTAPLERLSSIAGTLGSGNLSARAILTGPAETRLLADSFNKMADSIEAREHKLQESERYFRALFNTVSDVALMHEFPAGKFIEVNDAAVSILGYSRQEFNQLSVSDIDDPSFVEGMTLEEVFKTVSHGKTAMFRRGGRKADGTIIPLEIHSCLFEYHGREAVLSIARDITERIKAEEALKAEKQYAEEATELKDKYVSLVSHDLKNPLHAMLGSLKMVMGDVGDHSNRRVNVMLESAFNSGLSMLRLINEILDINRFRKGKVRFNFRFIDARSVAEKTLENFSQEGARKGIRLTNSVPEKSRFYTDAALFTEVINNLVSNAVKFCRRGDAITLFIPDDRISTLAVRDTGMGISEGALNDIFSYDSKTSTTGTGGESGTGFGLPLSRDIMRAMGGVLSVESAPGWGSVFYAELPFVKPRILLVDDDPDARIVLRGCLEPLNVDITEAINGKEALDIIPLWKPHLVILDLVMPLMDGFATLERLKLEEASASMPVLVLTGDTDMETRERIFRLGAQDYLQKPIIADDLVPRVRRFIV